MRKNARSTVKYLIMAIFVALAVTPTTSHAQNPPVLPEGIEGTWDMQVQWRTCDDGTPQLQPTPDLRSFAAGGVLTELDASIWCDIGHCTSLGVWKHVDGRRYTGTYKRFRLNSDTGQLIGSTIVVTNITHEADDSLTATDNLSFYDPAGVLEGTRCRTAVGTRFKGEN